MGHEIGRNVHHSSAMASKTHEEEAYIKGFCDRVQRLRMAMGRDWTQERMAAILRVSIYSYQKYEIRSPLPHYLLENFALITECSIEYLITGRGRRGQKQIDNLS